MPNMLRGSQVGLRPWLTGLTVAAAIAACGPKESPPASPAGASARKGDDWCEPMPDLGDACKQELKECAIVCDYISDTCVTLVCMGGRWDYVERGGEEKAEE